MSGEDVLIDVLSRIVIVLIYVIGC